VSGLRIVVNSAAPARPTGYTPLNLARPDSKPVFFSSGFAFSFFGVDYDRVYVGSNGYLTFGGADTTGSESGPTFVGPLPRIAALFDSLNPLADGTDGTLDAYLRQTADELDVLWLAVPESVNCPANTFEVKLRRGGAIDIHYDYLRSLDAIVGVTPGGSPATHAIDFTSGVPYHGAHGEAIFETFTGPITSPSHCVDLGACTLHFAPNGDGGYDVTIDRPSDAGEELAVRSVDPSSGPEHGGQHVTVRGGGFANDAFPTFGGSMATSFVVVDSSTITCSTPAGTGTVDVAVTSGGGTATLPGGYRYVPAPSLSSVAPAAGPEAGGTRVTLRGSHLTDVSAMRFGDAAVGDFAVVDDSTITLTTPPGHGTVTVYVGSPGGYGSLAGAFTYSPPPVLTGVTPASGPERGGNHVLLAGRNFTRTSDTRVFFGDREATPVNVVSSTSIDVVAPSGHGTVGVGVDESFGSSRLANAYTYIPPPTLSSISPARGPASGGTLVTLRGANFGRADDLHVAFGGSPATGVTLVDATTLTARTPAGSGVVDVRVSNSNGDASLPGAFTYLPPPSLDSISPPSGSVAGGTGVTLHGANFSPAESTSVRFGASSALEVHVVASDTITCLTPPGTGTVDVVLANSNGSATLAGAFTYTTGREFECRRGNVNAHGDGGIVDVLFVNGTSGGDAREVRVGRTSAIVATVAAAPGADRSRFCIYVWRGRPSESTVSTQPFNLGDMCMPTPLDDGTPQPTGVMNNLGFSRLLGRSTMPSEPAPSTLFSLPTGTHGRAQFFIQGFIEDATAPSGISVTNGIQVLTD
jgi:IPT/TIG domain-containing protein